MRYRLRAARAPVFGIGLSDAALCATAVDGSREAGAKLDVRFTDWRAELPSALEDVRAMCRVPPTVHIAVLGSLCATKNVHLPPLAEADRVRVLSRTGTRYLPLPPGPLAICCAGTECADLTRVHAMSGSDLEALLDAAGAAGVRVASVVPGREALARAVLRSVGPEKTLLLIATPKRMEALVVRDGRLLETRQHLGPDVAPLLERMQTLESAAGEATAIERLVISAESLATSPRDAVLAQLRAHSIPVDSTLDSHAAAAELSDSVPGQLLLERQRDERDRADHRWAAARVAIALLLLVMSLSAEWWGAARELERASDGRARIRERVAATLELRERVDRIEESLADIRAVEEDSPDLALLLSTLALHLPSDASLARLRVFRDSLLIEGVGQNASRVFAGLSDAPGLRDVAPSAPVRREVTEIGERREWFAIAARNGPRSGAHRAAPGEAPMRVSPTRGEAKSDSAAGTP